MTLGNTKSVLIFQVWHWNEGEEPPLTSITTTRKTDRKKTKKLNGGQEQKSREMSVQGLREGSGLGEGKRPAKGSNPPSTMEKSQNSQLIWQKRELRGREKSPQFILLCWIGQRVHSFTYPAPNLLYAQRCVLCSCQRHRRRRNIF